MPDINLEDYYNRYARDKKWSRILIRDGRGIQGAEINELQEVVSDNIRRLGDSLYSDGHVLSGCEPTIDSEEGVARMGAGKIYLDGEVRSVEEATLRLPKKGEAQIGVLLHSDVLTEHDDPTLRNPAKGCPDYMRAGAGRLSVQARWGLGSEAGTTPFYPVYSIFDMMIVNSSKNETSESDFMSHIARYDRESNGSYVIEGLNVRALPAADGFQSFSISEGKAHVQGWEVTRTHSYRLVVPKDADVLDSESEPHTFTPGSGGDMRVNVNHSPINKIAKVSVTLEATDTVTHGSFNGCQDNLPRTSITKITRVRQGSKVYQQGTDFLLTADKVDWTPMGSEPSPGSNYEITYQYRAEYEPRDQDTEGFTVTGLVPDSLVLIDYTYMLPRKDIIVIDKNGEISLVKGVPHRYAPVAPATPSGTLRLALVEQEWGDLPSVTCDAVKAVHMSTLEKMQDAIVSLYDLVALERMKTDAIISAPSTVHGVFVDNFADDDMRDAGTPQTAAIVDGELMLPIGTKDTQFAGTDPVTLEWDNAVFLEQTARTGSMKINPYQAFDPIPITMTLDPSVDRWSYTDTENAWTSDETRRITTGSGSSSTTTVSTSVEVAAVNTRQDENMRVREVALSASGLGPSEKFKVLFDGVEVDALGQDTAAPDGEVATTFRIPAGIPSGSKLVELRGTGSTGYATYTGEGTISQNVYRNVTTYTTRFFTPAPLTSTSTSTEGGRVTFIKNGALYEVLSDGSSSLLSSVDPLAQTFTLSVPFHATGVEVFFTKRGATPARVQIRTVSLGLPTQDIVAQGEIAPAAIQENAVNRIVFPFPVFLEAGEEYAIVVLTDSPDHEVAVAELGQWDVEAGRWITAQPYQTGTLLSSANASTWTPHQTMDLWFRLLGAYFTKTTRKVELGKVSMSGVSDLLPLADVQYPVAGTDVTFVISKDKEEVARVQAGQILPLTQRLDGEYDVSVELSGTQTASPILFGGPQLVTGKIAEEGTYFSRSFACGAGKKVSVRIEALTPGSSGIKVYVQTGTETFEEAELKQFEQVGDGWRRLDYELPCNFASTRVKVVLTGGPSERPYARSLRAVILDA